MFRSGNYTIYSDQRKIDTPNMRLHATYPLAAKNHAASVHSLALPPQECCIIEET
jgi:hypothetical protein